MQFQRIPLARSVARPRARRVAAPDALPETQQTSELQTLAEGFLTTICRISAANAGAVRLYSGNGKELQLAGSVGLPPEILECESRVGVSCGACGLSAQDHTVHSSDVSVCAHRSGNIFFGAACKSVVAVPLQHRGQDIGLLNLFFPAPKELSAEVEQLFEAFGELLGIALENARLARENRRMSLVAERQAMANEVHDSLAQTLVFARMRMNLLGEAIRQSDSERATGIANDINQALGDSQKAVRELITHFRSPMDPAGLEHALEELTNGFTIRSGIELEYVNLLPRFELPVEHELQVFNIVREILSNVAKHSDASHALLQVSRRDGQYHFLIEDDGHGINDDAPTDGHYGLTIMQERARRLNGEVRLTSTPGAGTRVELRFPDPASRQVSK